MVYPSPSCDCHPFERAGRQLWRNGLGSDARRLKVYGDLIALIKHPDGSPDAAISNDFAEDDGIFVDRVHGADPMVTVDDDGSPSRGVANEEKR